MVHMEIMSMEKIDKCPRLRINHGKFRFKYLCRKWIVSIIHGRNRRKLISENRKILNERIEKGEKTIKRN